MTDQPIYIVTDGEFDGLIPGRNSMLAFASIAVTPDGKTLGEFEAVLERLEGTAPDPETTAFWNEFPEAYAAATHNPQPPSEVMTNYVKWIRNLGGSPIFVSHPLALDGAWIDFYLKRFTDESLVEGPWRKDRMFKHTLCLTSFVVGRLGRGPLDYGNYPAEWLGNHKHTHRAIDDARGYANLIVYLESLRISSKSKFGMSSE